jgi:hypothetical protein
MDPSVCYRELYEAMRNGDYETAKERADALNAWIKRGGFYPNGYTKAEVDAYLVNVLRQIADRSIE